MKLTARQIDGFLKQPSTSAVLIYGPDSGLVRERAGQLTRLVAGDVADPFRVAELTPAMLRDDPARLADEAQALSLTGGRRVIRLRDASDAVTALLDSLLAGPEPAGFVIVEAGDLGPRSSLRQLFEGSARAAALPCYRDEGGSLVALVDSTLKNAGLTATPEARAFLLDSLGGDRGVSRSELEKLLLYVGSPARQVTLGDVVACVGDSAASSLDDIAMAIGDGDPAAMERAIDRGLQDGNNPVGILRAVSRHFLRLHQAMGMLAGGGDVERAIRSLRPPVHFRLQDRFARQLRRWPAPALSAAIDRLVGAEIACKRTGAPAETLMRQAFLDIVRSAPRESRPR